MGRRVGELCILWRVVSILGAMWGLRAMAVPLCHLTKIFAIEHRTQNSLCSYPEDPPHFLGGETRKEKKKEKKRKKQKQKQKKENSCFIGLKFTEGGKEFGKVAIESEGLKVLFDPGIARPRGAVEQKFCLCVFYFFKILSNSCK